MDERISAIVDPALIDLWVQSSIDPHQSLTNRLVVVLVVDSFKPKSKQANRSIQLAFR